MLCARAVSSLLRAHHTPAAMVLRRLSAPAPRARVAWASPHSPAHLRAPAAAAAAAAARPGRSPLSTSAAAAAETASASAPSKPAAAMPHNVVATLRARGLVQDVTGDDLERDALAGPLTVYCGFDPTADSLHLGNLLGIVVLAWFLRCGHRPLALLGGATARVGDPSGRQTERPVLSEAEIEANGAAIGRTLGDILRRAAAEAGEAGGGKGASASSASASAAASTTASSEVRVLNNLDWFGPMSLLTFLREVGKHARVGTMMAKDSVKSRMAAAAADGGGGSESDGGGGGASSTASNSGGGLSFTEFTYQLLQGYDYVHLARNEGVRVQVGGSDQWGNITAGTDLIRRLGAAEGGGGGGGGNGGADGNGAAATAAPLAYHGLTFPLLVDAEGRKVGKSTATGAVWLSAARLSPYKFYQALFATADADVPRFLKMLTFLDLEEISEIEISMRSEGYVPNTAQRRLAEEVTRFVHGPEGLAQALRATEALRPGAAKKAAAGEDGGGGGGAAALDAETLEAIAGDAPTAELPRAELVGKSVVDVVVAAGLLKTKGEARRMVKNGGVYVNNAKVAASAAAPAGAGGGGGGGGGVDGGGGDATLSEGDLIDGRVLLLAAGKKNKMLVRVV